MVTDSPVDLTDRGVRFAGSGAYSGVERFYSTGTAAHSSETRLNGVGTEGKGREIERSVTDAWCAVTGPRADLAYRRCDLVGLR